MKVEFARLAAAEMRASVAAYNLDRRGLGKDFRAEVRKLVKGIVAHPERWPVCGRKYRRAAVSRFPYIVYYNVEDDIIRVVRVVHGMRDRQQIEELLP